jgi:hypothetical protein
VGNDVRRRGVKPAGAEGAKDVRRQVVGGPGLHRRFPHEPLSPVAHAPGSAWFILGFNLSQVNAA